MSFLCVIFANVHRSHAACCNRSDYFDLESVADRVVKMVNLSRVPDEPVIQLFANISLVHKNSTFVLF
jgi:hypothetical protein